jgi:hypothetical protein
MCDDKNDGEAVKEERMAASPPPAAGNTPLPCPFCGSRDVLAWATYVICHGCHANGPPCPDEPDKVVSAWNRREHAGPPGGTSEAIRAALEEFADCIDATSGIYSENGLYYPVADPEWSDLATAYIHACEALGREPMVQTPEEEDATEPGQ